MTGSAEDSLDVYGHLIVEEEARRRALKGLIKHEIQLGHDPTNTETELREIEDILAALRARRSALRSEQRARFKARRSRCWPSA